jgi:hypothetical protein
MPTGAFIAYIFTFRAVVYHLLTIAAIAKIAAIANFKKANGRCWHCNISLLANYSTRYNA